VTTGVAKLPLDEQQALATLLLDEIESEHRWSRSFWASQGVLGLMATHALREHQAGTTQALDDLT
jgi:hypothetical protein